MIEFTAIASSSAGNAYTLTDGHTRLLLDCGLPWKELQRRLQFRTSDLAGILCSHEHGDHSKGLKDAMRAGLDVYASAGTYDALKLSGNRRHDITARKRFDIGTWRILPFQAVHDAADPLGFLLASEAGKVLFLTDSAYCVHTFRGLTHICIECNHSIELLREQVGADELSLARKRRLMHSHMSLERLQEMLEANDLSQVREIHLLHLSDAHSDAELFQRTIMRQTGKPVLVAPR